MPDRYRRNSGQEYIGQRGNGGRYEDMRRYRRNDEEYYYGREYNEEYSRRSDYGDYRPASRSSGHFRQNSGYRGMSSERNYQSTYYGQNKSSGTGKKLLVVFFVFVIIIGNMVLFSVLDSVGDDKNVQQNSGIISNNDMQVQETISETDIKKAHIDKLMAEMTTEEKVGQLLLIRSNGRDAQEFSELIAQCKVGGIVLFKSDFEGKTKQGVKDMNGALQSAGGGDLLICVDEEGGTVVRMSSLSELRSEKYKSPQDLYKIGGFDEIREDTVNKCEFLKTYGVNVNFAPVADVVTEKSAFMYKRAFGKNAEATGEYVKTVVTAMEENKVGSSVKHFPGYGNSTGDTHVGLDHNTLSIGSLKASDLVPFQYAVDAGVDSIMVTHTIIDEVDPENPASLSPECVALIRDYLEFDGVILTDALDMGAIIEFCDGEDPCVQAFLAGIDMLCLPSDPTESYTNLLNAVNEGKISFERLDESVERILKWKFSLGLYDE